MKSVRNEPGLRYAKRLEPPNPNPHLLLPPPHQRANSIAHTHGTVTKVFTHGIQFIDAMADVAGIMAMVAGTGAIAFFSFFLATLLDNGPRIDWASLGGALFLLCFVRLDFVGFRYNPVLFNRATQKVHVFNDEGTDLAAFWRWFGNTNWSIHTYDWACVRAEVAEITVLASANMPRQETLLFLAVTDTPGSATVVARVGVGFADRYVGTEAAEQRWEHIRRYMQEGGPPLAPGDHLWEDRSRMTLWGALTYGQPLIGPGSWGWWTGRNLHGMWPLTITFGLLALILLPISVLAGLLRGLAHWTKPEPRWPADIMADVDKAKSTQEPP